MRKLLAGLRAWIHTKTAPPLADSYESGGEFLGIRTLTVRGLKKMLCECDDPDAGICVCTVDENGEVTAGAIHAIAVFTRPGHPSLYMIGEAQTVEAAQLKMLEGTS